MDFRQLVWFLFLSFLTTYVCESASLLGPVLDFLSVPVLLYLRLWLWLKKEKVKRVNIRNDDDGQFEQYYGKYSK